MICLGSLPLCGHVSSPVNRCEHEVIFISSFYVSRKLTLYKVRTPWLVYLPVKFLDPALRAIHRHSTIGVARKNQHAVLAFKLTIDLEGTLL